MANLKTCFLKDYVDKIDSLNDQLWYYLFATEELNKRLSDFSDKANENYTTDLFKNNPYSKKIHIKAGLLPKHQKENKNLTFGAYFATCYEISSTYLKQAFDTLKSFNSLTTYIWDKRKEPERNFNSLLTIESLPSPKSEILETFTYLRLRRNHYTHIIEFPNQRLLDFIRISCARLNTFWGKPKTTIHLDFTKTLVRDFTLEETIELIKLVRICVIEIDHHIAGLLDLNSIIKYLVEREFTGKKTRLNTFTQNQRIEKIVNIGKIEFGLNLNSTQISPFIIKISR